MGVETDLMAEPHVDRPVINEAVMAETGKPKDEGVAPPTVTIHDVTVPDPKTGSEPKSKDPVRDAEVKPDDPDKAAKDGLA